MEIALDLEKENVVERSRDTEEAVYSSRWYEVDQSTIDPLKTLHPHRPILAALNAWFWIFVLVKVFLSSQKFIYLYPLVLFFIAGRAGVFLQLAHEAAHDLISKGKFNDWFGNWIACYPIGLDLKGYGEPHLRHHACTNKICDPLSDSEKYRICNVKNPKLWLLLAKDLFGITAISMRLLYSKPDANTFQKDADEDFGAEEGYTSYDPSSSSLFQTAKKYLSISFVQLLILAFLFRLNVIHYFFLWLVPLLTVHMFLMRIRGIAEHGLGIQLGVKGLDQKNRGVFYTRSFGAPVNRYPFPFLNLLERWLIGSLNVYYHHEHHLYPKVPYYHLPKVHRRIAQKMNRYNPYIFSKGYFACLFFSPKSSPSLSPPGNKLI